MPGFAKGRAGLQHQARAGGVEVTVGGEDERAGVERTRGGESYGEIGAALAIDIAHQEAHRGVARGAAGGDERAARAGALGVEHDGEGVPSGSASTRSLSA